MYVIQPAWLPGSGAAVDVQEESHCQRELSTHRMISVSSESSMLVPAPGFYKSLSLFQHSYMISRFASTSYMSNLIPDLLLQANGLICKAHSKVLGNFKVLLDTTSSLIQVIGILLLTVFIWGSFDSLLCFIYPYCNFGIR